MKRPLLLAALLATSGLVGTTAKAEPLQMFNINTPSAGVVNFSGTGTANFNQSLGTNNSFNVGSSTNLGVNASASSTEDYTSTGSASLDLAGTSRLQQTIGTATSAFNAATAAQSSATAAHTSASSVANASSTGESWSSSWDSSYRQSNGWELKRVADAGAAEAGVTADGYYKVDDSGAILTGADNFVAEGDWNDYSNAAWKSEWQETYDTTYAESYAAAVSSANQAVEQTDRQGVISGEFNTTDTGSSTAALESLASSLEASSEAAASTNSGVTKTTDASGVVTYAATAGGDDRSGAQLKSDWEQAYQSEFATAYSTASAAIERKSVSEVQVAGIGVIADVNAASTSNFTATSSLIPDATRDGNGNGNASAGSSLATSSYANQSNSTTANAFMQAFSGGLPEPTGTESLVSITSTGNAQNPAYSVVTDRTTTIRKTQAYTADAATGVVTASGNATEVEQ